MSLWTRRQVYVESLAMLVMIVWSFALDQAIKTMENQQERTLGDLFDKNIDKLLSDENFRKRIEQKIKQVHYGLEGIWWQTGVYSYPSKSCECWCHQVGVQKFPSNSSQCWFLWSKMLFVILCSIFFMQFLAFSIA